MKVFMSVLATPVLLATLISTNSAFANSSPHPAQAAPPVASTTQEAKEIEIKAPFLPPMERAKEKTELQFRSNLIRGM